MDPYGKLGGGAQLFAEFAISGKCLELRDRMFALLTQDIYRSRADMSSLHAEFAGAVFEELAYYAISEETDSSALLSPDDTLDYFQLYLHPDRSPIGHTFTTALDGISVPDGLLMSIEEETSYPKAVYEYTLNRKGKHAWPYFEPKYYFHRLRRQKFPHIFDDIPLIFVVPTQPGLVAFIHEQVGEGDIELIELPFTHRDFGRFVNELVTPLVEDAGLSRGKVEIVDTESIIDEYPFAEQSPYTPLTINRTDIGDPPLTPSNLKDG